MSAFEELLRLQDHDIRIDQLRHKRATLPEQAAVDEIARAQAQLDLAVAPVRAVRDEIARDQKRLEDEVALVQGRAVDMDAKLYGGAITSPREAQAMQADLESLNRRQRQLEDQVLELMEQAEPVDAELADLDARRQALEADAAEAGAALERAVAETEAELADALAARDDLVAGVPAAQLDEYERLRPQMGGVAVARLVGTQCGGCHLSLSAMALQSVRRLAPDAVAHCEECGRLLVR